MESRVREANAYDSYYLLAVFNARDQAHGKAVARTLTGELITHDWALTEVADALSDAVNRNRCVPYLNDVRRSPRVEVIPASRELFELGWELYRDRSDKDWSLTDCISFVVMKQHGITTALTGDHHFEQAGFTVLFSSA